MSEFEREDRYAVIKYKKLTAYQWTLVTKLLEKFDKARVDCVVVEKDWPEYNFVWLMLEHRMAGYPVPDFNDVKCAADVQAAQSELSAVRRRESLLKEKLADCEKSEAALREELAAQKETVALFESEYSKQSVSLTAAEQRNAELIKARDSSRTSYELWADSEGYDVSRNAHGDYAGIVECSMWTGWAARGELNSASAEQYILDIESFLHRSASFVKMVHKYVRKEGEYAPLHWQEMVELDKDLSGLKPTESGASE